MENDWLLVVKYADGTNITSGEPSRFPIDTMALFFLLA